MNKYINTLCDSFYMIFISISGVFICFWSSVFFLGSHESIQNLIKAEGITVLAFKRFVGFALLGILLSFGIALMSLLVQLLSKKKDFLEPFHVFVVSSVFQIFCSFIGSLIFMYNFS